ncbi:PLP-dependent aminotransferase family protein [Pelosinus sp. sgz500959]|uniref:MocR-like pyridoxine biosynthesis transcription factor PdxR n=1 Tax=Pelosinus sp. sgz500959 TaxID=3242472 RepID=UPI00366D3681
MWGIILQRHSEITLARQIYQALRKQMLKGCLQPGDMLPSTRELAKELSISRNTAYESYEMLAAEGYIVSRQGAPTRVAEGLILKNSELINQQAAIEKIDSTVNYRADFRTGLPDLRHFPQQRWLQLIHQASEKLGLEHWGYTEPEGLPVLREQISAWLLRSRGLVVAPQEIFITAGATHALHILAELLSTKKRQELIIEDPCHMGMLRVLQKNNFRVKPVPVDAQGLQTNALTNSDACAVYVTPSHQFPLGGILPAGRRTALVRFAQEQDLYLIEDDYDSEFRYIGSPVAPLYTLDPQRVIYVGTFSKILFPALRIGYIILPRSLQPLWCQLRLYTDVQNPPFAQAALAEFLSTRKLDRHIQTMRRIYGQRRKFLLETLAEKFGNCWQPWGDAAGLHIALEFPGRRFDQDFAYHCQLHGIRITTVDYHSIMKGKHLGKILLGYGHLEPQEIKHGISLLAEQM